MRPQKKIRFSASDKKKKKRKKKNRKKKEKKNGSHGFAKPVEQSYATKP